MVKWPFRSDRWFTLLPAFIFPFSSCKSSEESHHILPVPKSILEAGTFLSRVSIPQKKIEWNRVNHQSENLTLVPSFLVFTSFEFQVLIFTKIKSTKHRTWSLFNKVHLSVWNISCYYPSHFRTEASEDYKPSINPKNWMKSGESPIRKSDVGAPIFCFCKFWVSSFNFYQN